MFKAVLLYLIFLSKSLDREILVISCEMCAVPYEKLSVSYENMLLSYETSATSYEVIEASYENTIFSYEMFVLWYEVVNASHERVRVPLCIAVTPGSSGHAPTAHHSRKAWLSDRI